MQSASFGGSHFPFLIGVFMFVGCAGDGTPTVTATSSPTPIAYPYDRTLYLRGTMNNWSGDEAILAPFKFEAIDDHTLYVEAEFPFGDQRFKVANSDWAGGSNFGNPAGSDDVIQLGLAKVMGDNGFDLNLKVNSPGVFSFTVDHTELQSPSVVVAFLYEVEGSCSPDITSAKARWMDAKTLVWHTPEATSYALYAAPEGGITLTDGVIAGVEETIQITDTAIVDATHTFYDTYPYLRSQSAFTLDAQSDVDLKDILTGQLVLASHNEDGTICDATEVQTYGVIDDLSTYDGDDLGLTFDGAGVPTFKLWAPTAKAVALSLFVDADASEATSEVAMVQGENGVWSHSGEAAWTGQYYLYDVDVYVRGSGEVLTNSVTDPYSIGLSENSERSLIVDLNAPEFMPDGWDFLAKPTLDAFEDITLYELHIRDFSAADTTCSPENKGKFLAFAEADSDGSHHLDYLADSGITHIHLLPAFDIATINEDPLSRTEPTIPEADPNSEEQQAAVEITKDDDAFNWGYDPYHFMVPEGSYATTANGGSRILEFRRMVQSLNDKGLRVVMDQVYNHTNSAVQNDKSVLDKIVPGYYYRLDASGNIQGSSCCPDTATEHRMMEKLMVDAVKLWAKSYKVDGFRFDLMGHHTQANMMAVRAALDGLNIENDGVDGGAIYMYGEGWKFGSLDAILPDEAMSQKNSHGYGIGTFNDRIRDSIRGGSPLSQDLWEQGFTTGAYYNDNYLGQGSATEEAYLEAQKSTLLNLADNIRIGLAGNLRDYTFTNALGVEVSGAEINYRGSSGAGYTADPQEIINYVSAHDNQTLWDNIQAKAPFSIAGDTLTTASMDERIRMHNLSMSLVVFGQGIPFFHAGSELLRSKSGDKDSYNSGDWFNQIDWSRGYNNWGAGLPVAEKNAYDWDFWRPRLGDVSLIPSTETIDVAADHFAEILGIRRSSLLFRLRSAEQIQERVQFLNAARGVEQVPGLIVVSIADGESLIGGDLDPENDGLVVLFNATLDSISFMDSALIGAETVHPMQASGSDPVLVGASCANESGLIIVPAQTALVCVRGI